MKDEDSLPTTTNGKRESSDLNLVGKGRYKFWALAVILLLAFWSMFTGTVTLRSSAGNLSQLSDNFGSSSSLDLDVLEIEDRQKLVKHMWELYTFGQQSELPKFWREAFEAAYEELSSDSSPSRDAAITEIAKMSFHSVDLDLHSPHSPLWKNAAMS